MSALGVDRLLMEAEAKWSLGDDDEAVVLLEEALTGVWGLPDEVTRVSEAATRLAAARASEPLDAFSRRAADAAVRSTTSRRRQAPPTWTRRRRGDTASA